MHLLQADPFTAPPPCPPLCRPIFFFFIRRKLLAPPPTPSWPPNEIFFFGLPSLYFPSVLPLFNFFFSLPPPPVEFPSSPPNEGLLLSPPRLTVVIRPSSPRNVRNLGLIFPPTDLPEPRLFFVLSRALHPPVPQPAFLPIPPEFLSPFFLPLWLPFPVFEALLINFVLHCLSLGPLVP